MFRYYSLLKPKRIILVNFGVECNMQKKGLEGETKNTRLISVICALFNKEIPDVERSRGMVIKMLSVIERVKM